MQVQDDDKTIIGGFSLELTHSVQVDDGLKYLVIKELSIGRSDTCDIKIDDKKISRMHAKFEIVDMELTITDLNSSNGTFVNGERINETTRLKNNDVVKVESHELKIIIGANIPEKVEDDDKTRVVDSLEKTPDVIDVESKEDNAGEEKVEDSEIQKSVDLEPSIEKDAKVKPEVKEVINKSKEEIPASWVEETGSVDGTRMMDPKEIEAIKSGVKRDVTPADSTMTCLHCFSENAAEQIFELPISNSEEASGWEIGRDSNCDIVIEHSSVSNRHAQIIHQRGRWKIVNLVSTNGIVINGQKKLSAYLGDGDKIGLGSVDLIFKTPKSNKTRNVNVSNGAGKGKNLIIPVIMGLILVGLAVGIYLNI
jgi:pSer/pThr/pTyr-binding forkhead associated (FHA) protein